ncbi:MAG: amidase [Actinobacteria bacterium]|nr:amidase [Actinomycetota bacterium]
MTALPDVDGLALAAMVRNGEASPAELLEAAMAGVDQVDPRIAAIASLQHDAALRAIDAGLPDGPFTGVPFLLKDLGCDAVDHPATQGSRLFSGYVSSFDAELFVRLRRTGLVTFGRTTSPELGVGPTTEAAVYGRPTRNPWDTDHVAGGSSGGAGAAVSAGIVPMAHGSDGGGSVRIPASSCGLFGLKPTRARLPDGPAAGESWAGMAIDGFLTRSVRDSAALLDATSGGDLGAPYVAPPLAQAFSTAILVPPTRLRVAVSTRSFTGDLIHPECAAAVEHAARLLDELGHEVVEAPLHGRGAPVPLDVVELMRAWTDIVACGTALTVRQVEQARGRPVETGELDAVTHAAVRHATPINGARYLEAIEVVHASGRAMARAMEAFDVLVTTTLAEPPALIGRFVPSLSWMDAPDFVEYRLGAHGVLPYSPFAPLANATGQPAMSVPLHWTAATPSAPALPVGVHVMGRFGEDDVLIALAAQLEQAAPWWHRRPPCRAE